MSTQLVPQILLVEDELIVAKDQARRLEREGFDVELARSGAEAVEKAIHGPGSLLVLMDIRLDGGMDGITAAEEILNRRELPIVFLTAYADPKTLREVSRVTRYGYVLKNSGLPLLLQAIRMAFDLFNERRKVVEREKRLIEKSAQLQRLSRHIQEMREEQNRYVAREIHDELGQALTSLDILLTLTEEGLQGEPPESRDSLRRTLGEAREVLARTSATVRHLVGELRPSVLDHLGPVEAMRAELEEFERKTAVTATFENELSGEPVIGEKCALALFRIVQEALTNVYRHAGAQNLYLRLHREGGALIVTVTDDGVGFDPASAEGEETFGLLGMEERAEACGGSIAVSSEPDKGTTVSVTIPEEMEA
ncbi:MAG: response regulator [Spirochaetaceae bacterium]